MQKLFKGSALVYTLIMMLFLMVGALALMTTTIIQQRGVSGTTESVRAFQVANDGFEDVIANYKKNPSAILISELIPGACSGETITRTIATGGYVATFTDGSGTALTCSSPLSDVAQVKVVSTVGSSTRAIEAAFATTGLQCFDVYDNDWLSMDLNVNVSKSDQKVTELANKSGDQVCSEVRSGSTCTSDVDASDVIAHGGSKSNSCETVLTTLDPGDTQQGITRDDVVRCCY